MLYISDLHIGRVNPKHFKFGIDVEQKRYDLPQFLTQKLLPAGNLPQLLNGVEPPYYGYRRTEGAFQAYLALADKEQARPCPRCQKRSAPGILIPGQRPWPSIAITRGSAPGHAPHAKPGIYQGALVEGSSIFRAATD